MVDWSVAVSLSYSVSTQVFLYMSAGVAHAVSWMRRQRKRKADG